MQLLITGGTGFIGSRLVKALLADSCSITVVSRQSPEQVKKSLSPEVNVVSSIAAIDPSDVFDAVINLAGEGIMEKRWSASRKKELLESRVGVTSELVDLLERMQNRPKLLISGSAVGYYGNHGSDSRLDESDTAGHDFAASLCQQWEQAAQRANALGITVVVVRTGIVLHPDGGALAKMLPAFKVGMGGPVGHGNQMMSWIHREDMVRLLVFLLKTPGVEGVYNATAPNPVSNKDFVHLFAKALHRPALIPVPAAALRLALGESSQLLLEGQAVYPERLAKAGFQFNYPDLQQAFENLFS